MDNKSEKQKILIVEDEEPLRRAWQRILEREGMATSVAATAEEAAEILKTDKEIAVIFTDLNLPGMSGQELIAKVKEAALPCCVNVLTGLATIENAVECMLLGACDYVAKPCNLSEIVVKANRCLDHYRQRREVTELKRAVIRYEELDRLKSEFVANVSHELRTPLFSMQGALELLKTDLKEHLKGEAGSLFDVVRQNAGRLAQIINNILNFSKMEQGTLKPKFASVAVAAILEKTFKEMMPLLRQKNLEVEPLTPDFNGSVEADGQQLEQLFCNLIGNAIKFTPNGGRISARINDVKTGIEITIRDSGIGIAPQYHEQIFERFYQVDGSATREAGGCGIGLAIVKSIAQMHGGSIRVRSAAGQGSAFTIYLPKKQKNET